MNTISSIVMHKSKIECIKIWVIAWADKFMKNDWAELKQQDIRTLAQTMEFFDREGHEFVVNSF